MIEKLNEYKITSRDGSFINVECNTKIINTLVRKINELVDAFNELQEAFESIHPYLKYKDLNKTPADPYAEQRKWIGKLCWFYNIENKSLGILEKIDKSYAEDGEVQPYLDDTWTHYTRCEPVKPDDNIIFKGE